MPLEKSKPTSGVNRGGLLGVSSVKANAHDASHTDCTTQLVSVTFQLPADLLRPLIKGLEAAELEAIRQGLAGPGGKR